jgi:hypothetical protein
VSDLASKITAALNEAQARSDRLMGISPEPGVIYTWDQRDERNRRQIEHAREVQRIIAVKRLIGTPASREIANQLEQSLARVWLPDGDRS